MSRLKKTNSMVFFLLFLILLCMNGVCPYLSDDWHFMFVWEYFDPLPTTHRIENMQDIMISMKNYYAKSGGRVIPHFLAYCFMTQNKWLFNVLNSIMGTTFCFLTYKLGTLYTKEKSPLWFPLGALLTLCSSHYIGDNMLWLSGAVNYLWSGVLLLICIYWLLVKWETAKVREFLLMIPLFMLSAATNEITGGMLAVSLFLRILTAEQKRIRRSLVLLASLVPGMCLVLLAEGNSVRRNTIERKSAPSLIKIISTSGMYLNSLQTKHYFVMMLILTAFFLSLLLHDSWRNIFKRNLLVLVGMSGVTALGALGFFTERPLFFGVCLLVAGAYQHLLWLYETYQLQEEKGKFLLFVLRSFFFSVAVMLIFSMRDFIGLWDFIGFKSMSGIIAMFLLTALTAVVLMLGIRLEKIVEKLHLSESDISILRKIKKNVPRLTAYAVFAIPALSFCINSVDFFRWSAKYQVYEKNLISYIENDNLEGAKDCEQDDTDFHDAFIPVESGAAPDYYVVEWMAFYYKKDVADFVKKYAEPVRKREFDLA